MKDILSPTRSLTPEEEQVLQGITDEVYDRFVNVVSEGRKLPEDHVRKLADGRIYLAPEALKVGLVDSIGYRDTAMATARELVGLEKLRLIRYERLFSLRDMLSASSGALPPLVGIGNGLRDSFSPRLLYLWTIN